MFAAGHRFTYSTTAGLLLARRWSNAFAETFLSLFSDS
jgi:hypothetical protein